MKRKPTHVYLVRVQYVIPATSIPDALDHVTDHLAAVKAALGEDAPTYRAPTQADVTRLA